MATCPRCNRHYREPPGEEGDHGCPGCGLWPEDLQQTECGVCGESVRQPKECWACNAGPLCQACWDGHWCAERDISDQKGG